MTIIYVKCFNFHQIQEFIAFARSSHMKNKKFYFLLLRSENCHYMPKVSFHEMLPLSPENFKHYPWKLFLAGSGLSCNTHDLSLWCSGSLVVACRLNCPVARGILVPWPGIELVSLALQDGFLTTGPSGKSLRKLLKIPIFMVCQYT